MVVLLMILRLLGVNEAMLESVNNLWVVVLGIYLAVWSKIRQYCEGIMKEEIALKRRKNNPELVR